MSRPPTMNGRQVVAMLTAQGFEPMRQKGSHLIMRSAEGGRSITVPMHPNRDVGRGVLARIMNDAGISRQREPKSSRLNTL